MIFTIIFNIHTLIAVAGFSVCTLINVLTYIYYVEKKKDPDYMTNERLITYYIEQLKNKLKTRIDFVESVDITWAGKPLTSAQKLIVLGNCLSYYSNLEREVGNRMAFSNDEGKVDFEFSLANRLANEEDQVYLSMLVKKRKSASSR